jgi:hypothetical protein
MKAQAGSRHRRLRRRRALKLSLLMLPALFWSIVFAALAGVRPLEPIAERVPDAAQLFLAAACLLFAAALGVKATGQDDAGRGRTESSTS